MRVVIIGGGFIGQLLHLFWPKARIFDWRSKAPDRSTRSLGPQYLWESIPELRCRQFNVVTTVDWKEPTPDRILAYKQKVGKDQDGSDWRAQFQSSMPGYDAELPEVAIEYGKRVVHVQRDGRKLIMADGRVERYDLLLSTIPLPSLLTLCGRGADGNQYHHRAIYMHHDTLHPDIEHDVKLDDGQMHVNYVSYPHIDSYRQTVRDGRIYTESLNPFHAIHEGQVVKILPGKIYAHPPAIEHLAWLAKDGVYGFGRFATWSPDELAHETIRKVRAFKHESGL